jgi:hypothetical protein
MSFHEAALAVQRAENGLLHRHLVIPALRSALNVPVPGNPDDGISFLMMGDGVLAPLRGMTWISNLSSIYLLLAGYAFENLTKGVRIAREGPQAMESLLLEWEGTKGHDLVGLFKKLKMPLLKKERKILEVLTAAVRYYGRYPTPLRREDPPKIPSMGETIPILDELWKKLISEFQKERERRRDPPATSPPETPLGEGGGEMGGPNEGPPLTERNKFFRAGDVERQWI